MNFIELFAFKFVKKTLFLTDSSINVSNIIPPDMSIK